MRGSEVFQVPARDARTRHPRRSATASRPGARWCAAIALLACSCAAAVGPGATDGGVGRDAVADAPADARADAGVVDAPADATPVEIRGRISALARARDRAAPSVETASTWLVLGSREPAQNALLVEPALAREGAAVFDRRLEIAGTAGQEPVSAAREGDRVAVVLQRAAAVPQVALLDGRTGAVLASAELSGLVAGTPQYAWVALRGDRVTVAASLFDPDRLAVRTFAIDPGALRQAGSFELDGHFTASLSDDDGGSTAGTILTAITPTHRMDRYRVHDTGLEPLTQGAERTVLPTSDGPTVARLTDDRWVIDGQDAGPLPRLSQINGNVSVAAAADGSAVVGLAADTGRMLVGWRRSAGEPLRWVEVPVSASEPGFRGAPAAHLDGAHRGVFYLEVFLGSQLPAVRYFALPDGP